MNIKTEFNYTDGGEKQLLEIVSRPDFDEYKTWREFSGNWPLTYHLSPLR